MRTLRDEIVALIANLPGGFNSPTIGMRPQTSNGTGTTVNVQSMIVNRYQGFRKYTTLFQVAIFGDSNQDLSNRVDTLRNSLHRAQIDGTTYYVNEAQQAYDEKDSMVRVIEVEAVYIDTSPASRLMAPDGFFPPFPTMPQSLAGVPWYNYPENNVLGYGAWISPLTPDRTVAFLDQNTYQTVNSEDLATLEFVGIKYKDDSNQWKDIQMPTMTMTDVGGRPYYYNGSNFNTATIKYGINPFAGGGVDFTMDFSAWPNSYFEGGAVVGSISELEVQFYIVTNEGLRVFHTLRAPAFYT